MIVATVPHAQYRSVTTLSSISDPAKIAGSLMDSRVGLTMKHA